MRVRRIEIWTCPERPVIQKLKSIGRATWQAFDDYAWLPLLVAGVLLMIVNFPS